MGRMDGASELTQRIWFGDPSLDQANERGADVLNGHLGIMLTKLGPDFLVGTMPIEERVHQPAGALHGGASVVLAETLASWAGTFVVDRTKYHCVGMEINANHLRPAFRGLLTGVARPISLGRRTHVWDIRISDDAGKLVCVSRCTLAVTETASAYGIGAG